eukprot:UN05617
MKTHKSSIFSRLKWQNVLTTSGRVLALRFSSPYSPFYSVYTAYDSSPMHSYL